MNKTITAAFAAVGMLVGLGASSGDVLANGKRDKLACYKWDIFPQERFKLNVKYHSRLTERKEEREFGHARQDAYSVNGKHVIFSRMATVDGTVVTAKNAKRGNPEGAHMGIHSIFVRGDGNFNEFARPVTVECTSEEKSATPKVWICQSRNEFDVYHGFSRLERVDASRDELCSIFENGRFSESDGARAREGLSEGGSMLPGGDTVE